MSTRLDTIDRHILKELQDNGRITNVELARRVGISAPPCLRRVRALEEAGYIKGYRGLLDEKLLGYEVTVFAMVHLSSQAEADLIAFEQFVRAQPLVRECWMLSGEIDFILKCVAPDLKTFQAFVTELTAAPHVRNVKTSLTLRNSKDAAAVPMETMRDRAVIAGACPHRLFLLGRLDHRPSPAHDAGRTSTGHECVSVPADQNKDRPQSGPCESIELNVGRRRSPAHDERLMRRRRCAMRRSQRDRRKSGPHGGRNHVRALQT